MNPTDAAAGAVNFEKARLLWSLPWDAAWVSAVSFIGPRRGHGKKRWEVKGKAYAVALSPDLKQALVSERYPLIFDSGRHSGVKLWAVEADTVQHDLSNDFKAMQIAAAACSADGKLLEIGKPRERHFILPRRHPPRRCRYGRARPRVATWRGDRSVNVRQLSKPSTAHLTRS